MSNPCSEIELNPFHQVIDEMLMASVERLTNEQEPLTQELIDAKLGEIVTALTIAWRSNIVPPSAARELALKHENLPLLIVKVADSDTAELVLNILADLRVRPDVEFESAHTPAEIPAVSGPH